MATDLKRHVGLAIRAERVARGLTQEQIAERIERTVETVSNIERGKAFPGLDTLEQICTALEISMAQVFNVDNGPPPSGRRLELQARLKALVTELSDADLEVAVDQVAALVRGRARSTRS